MGSHVSCGITWPFTFTSTNKLAQGVKQSVEDTQRAVYLSCQRVTALAEDIRTKTAQVVAQKRQPKLDPEVRMLLVDYAAAKRAYDNNMAEYKLFVDSSVDIQQFIADRGRDREYDQLAALSERVGASESSRDRLLNNIEARRRTVVAIHETKVEVNREKQDMHDELKQLNDRNAATNSVGDVIDFEGLLADALGTTPVVAAAAEAEPILPPRQEPLRLPSVPTRVPAATPPIDDEDDNEAKLRQLMS